MTKKQSEMRSALQSAKRVLLVERKDQFDCFTIAPARSYEQMDVVERRHIRRFDYAIAKINAALK